MSVLEQLYTTTQPNLNVYKTEFILVLFINKVINISTSKLSNFLLIATGCPLTAGI